MTVAEARDHYRTVRDVLRRERAMRERVLSEPRRAAAVDEIDGALLALEHLGQIVQVALAGGLLDQVLEQGPLLDVPGKRYV